MANLSIAELKERERQTWLNVADGWRRRDELLRKGAAPVTERMLELAEIGAGQHVLDIASGTGEPAIPAARLVGPQGTVTGTDLVEEMLMVAREKAALEGLDNVRFHCVDGEQLEFPSNSFDAVTIRWGLMFMPNPHTCLEQVLEMLKPAGRLVVACWAEPEHNPFVSLAMATLQDYMEIPAPVPGAPGIFAYGNRERLHNALHSVGFKDVAVERIELTVIEVENGTAYWDVLKDLAGPVVALVNQLDAKTCLAFESDLAKRADQMRVGDSLPMLGTTWVAAASK